MPARRKKKKNNKNKKNNVKFVNDNKNENRQLIKILFIWICILMGFCALYEILEVKYNLSKTFIFIIVLAVFLLVFCCAIILQGEKLIELYDKNKETVDSLSETEAPMFSRPARVLKALKKGLLPIIATAISLFISIYNVASASAENHVLGQIIGQVSDDAVILKNAAKASSNTREDTFMDTREDKQNDSQSHSTIKDENWEVNSESSKEEVNNSFLVDPSVTKELSQKENSRLYYLSDPYQIDYSQGEDAARKVLLDYIDDVTSIKLNNNFDDEAPASQKNILHDASLLESVLVNSNQLDEVISKRIQVWYAGYNDGIYEYGKPQIAWLISNNFQRYALAYWTLDGDFDTIKYYYYQSIKWAWKTLQFNTTNTENVKEIIYYIQHRYKDIADISSPGSEDCIYASTISNALLSIYQEMD